MSCPKKLIFNDIDGKFHVICKDNSGSFGDGYAPSNAIKSARIVTQDPIDLGVNYADLNEVCYDEKPDDVITDAETFISALAEIGGMKVIKVYDDDVRFLGYRMELVE